MALGLIIIGDEILSGKRTDKHFPKVLELFSERGMTLDWVQYLGDDRERCAAVFKQSFAARDIVFCCGGIGGTPDDHTRQAVAAALGLSLQLHPEAAQLISQRTAEMASEGRGSSDMTLPENQQRLRMGEFPLGARLIQNPYNKIPGFNIQDHWFVPGFPVMAWPMIQAVLDSTYRHLQHKNSLVELSMKVFEIGEADATPLMESIEAQFDGIKVYSLPSIGEGGVKRHIELGVKGNSPKIDEAFLRLKEGVLTLGAIVSTE